MTHTETSLSVARWAEEVFGPVTDIAALIRRAELELAELKAAVVQAAPAETVAAEAADVAILLHRLVALSGGGDLCTAIDAKMALNRQRSWIRAGDGTGRHGTERRMETEITT